jgi:hypothetical protein
MAKKSKFNMKLIVGGIIFVIVIVAIGYYLSRGGGSNNKSKTNTKNTLLGSIFGSLGSGNEHFTDSPVPTSRCKDMTCEESLNDKCGLRFVGNVLFKPLLTEIFEDDYFSIGIESPVDLEQSTIETRFNSLDAVLTKKANDFFSSKGDCIKKYYKSLVDLWNPLYYSNPPSSLFVFETEQEKETRDTLEKEEYASFWGIYGESISKINVMVRDINNLTSDIEVIEQNIKQYEKQRNAAINKFDLTHESAIVAQRLREEELTKMASKTTEKQNKEEELERAKCDINSCSASTTVIPSNDVVKFNGNYWESVSGIYSSNLGLNEDEWKQTTDEFEMLNWFIPLYQSTEYNFLAWIQFQFVALISPYKLLQKVNEKMPQAIEPSFLIFSQLRSKFLDSKCIGPNKETLTPNDWIEYMSKEYDTEYPDRVGTNEIGTIFSNVTLLLSLYLFQVCYKEGVFLDENENLDHSDISKYVMKNYMEYKQEEPDESCLTRSCEGHYEYRTASGGVHINPFLEFAILKELKRNQSFNYDENGPIVRDITEFTLHPYRDRPIDANYFHTDIGGSVDNSKPFLFFSNSSIFSWMMCFKMERG